MVVIPENCVLKIFFRYDKNIINKIKSISGRRYHVEIENGKKTTYWSTPDTPQNRKILDDLDFEFKENYLATTIISNLENKSCKKVSIKLGANLTIRHLNYEDAQNLKSKLTIINPKWIENKRMGRWNTEPKILKFYKESKNNIKIPKGLLYEFNSKIIDNRSKPIQINYKFLGVLREDQQPILDSIISKDFGTISIPTGGGKTVIALASIAERKCRTLIIVHTINLLNQWVERIKEFLNHDNIGIIGDGKKTIKSLSIGTVQTLYNNIDLIKNEFDYVIVDECHKTPSNTFLKILKNINCYYTLGLSATLYRNDGLSKLIEWYIGPCVHKITSKKLVESGSILPIQIIWKNTDFDTKLNPVTDYSKVLNELSKDEKRNKLICDDIANEYSKGSTCLILSDRKHHCFELSKILSYKSINSIVLVGGSKTEFEIGENKILIATGQLIGEGFDLPKLDTLFLCTPIKYKGRLIQYVGRIRRKNDNKKYGKIYDYIDQNIDVFVKSAATRNKTYQSL